MTTSAIAPPVASATAAGTSSLAAFTVWVAPKVRAICQTIVPQVSDDDLSSAAPGEPEGEVEANGALAENDDSLTEDATHSSVGVHDGAHVLAHEPHGQVPMIRHGNDAVCGSGDVLRKPGAARRQDDDPLAGLQVGRAALLHDASALVAGAARHQGVLLLR